MANVVGQLEIQLLANIARLQNDMDKATRSVDRAMSAIDKSVGFAQKALLGLGAGLTFGALIGSVDKAINTLGKLDDMAQKTGSSVENLSKLQKVATQFGGDFEAVNVGLNKFAKGLNGIDDAGGKTANALKAIGISQKFVKENDPSEVFVQVAKNLQNYKDGAGKAALATDLFGKAGVELLPYLNDVAENVDKMTGASAESAAQAAKFQDQLGGLKVKANEYFEKLAIDLLPAANSFIKALTDSNTESTKLAGNDSAMNWADSLGLGLSRVVDVLKIIPNFLRSISLSFEVVLNDIRTLNEAAKLGNPFELYKDAKAGKPVLADFASQLEQRNKTLKEANQAYDDLWNKPANTTEQAYLKAIADRKNNASPYVSPNSNQAMLDYIDSETKAKLEAEKKANEKAAIAEYNRKLELKNKIFEEYKKKDEELYNATEKADKKAHEVRMGLAEKFFEMDRKFIDVLDKTETKILDDSHKAKLSYFDDENKRINNAIKDRADKEKKLADDINKGITDALFRGFESGKSFIRNFIDTLKNAFQTTVLRPVIEAVITSSGVPKLASELVGSITGSSGTASSGGGLFSSISSIFTKSNSAIYDGIANLGGQITNGLGGIRDSIGTFIGNNSQLIGNLASYGGAILQLAQGNYIGAAATAIGTLIGGPVGGAIGSFVGGLFGGNDKGHRSGAGVGTSYNNGAFATNVVGKGTATKFDASYVDPLRGLSQQFATELGTLLNYFGQQANIYLGADFKAKQKGGKGDTKGEFGGTVNGVRFFSNFTYDQKDTQAFQSYVNSVLGTTLVTAIQSSTLSAGIKKFFNGLTAKEDVLNTINTLTSLSTALKDLPPVFQAIKNAIDNTEIQLNATQLQQSFNNIATYTSLFYSQSEQFASFTKQLTTTFNGMNLILPGTREGFRNLVDGIDTTTTSGLGLFNELVALAPTLDGYYKALQQQADAADAATDSFKALAEALSSDKFKTLLDFQVYQGITRNYGTGPADTYLKGLPSYDVGTSYVPNDGPAMIHQGEAILTASENASLRESNAALVYEMRSLNRKVDRMVYSIDQTATATKRSAEIMKNITPNGDAIQTELAA